MTAVEQPAVTYTASDVLNLTGCTYRQLDYICRALLTPPEVGSWRPGSGNGRRFTQDDLDLVHATIHLVRAGFGVRAAYAYAQQLTAHGHADARVGGIYTIRITIEGNTP